MRFPSLALLAATIVSVNACALTTHEDEEIVAGVAAVTDSGQCLVRRYTGENASAPASSFVGQEILARAGQRVSVAALEVRGDVEFDVLIVGADERAAATSASGDIKLAEITSRVDANYHFEIHDRSGRARAFRATIDVIRDRPDCVNGRRLCYRALGAQCKGISVLAPAQYLGDGRRKLWTSPGAQLHDTCCLAHSDGKFCGGNESRDLNPLSSDVVCAPEWNRAWYDTKSSAIWSLVFDPTQFEYAVAPVARAGGSYPYLAWKIGTGGPTDASELPPSGTWVDKSDAPLWCRNGVGTGLVSLFYVRCK